MHNDNRYLHLIRQGCPLLPGTQMFRRSLLVRGLCFLFTLLSFGCAAESLPALPTSDITTHTGPAAATPLTIAGVYLPFQNGFMVYIEGETCLYAYADGIILPRDAAVGEFSNYRYCLPFADLPEASEDAPDDPFGRVWFLYADVAHALGVPTGSVVRYATTFPPADPVVMGGVFYSGIITLPDGTMLYCGMRAATAGTCQLRAP